MSQQNNSKVPSLVFKMEDHSKQKQQLQNQTLGGKHGVVNYKDSEKKLSLQRQIQIKDIDIFSLRFSQDDKFIAAGCADGSVKILNAGNGQQLGSLQGAIHILNAPTTSVRWKPKLQQNDSYQLLSVNSDGSITHWDALEQKPIHRMIENKGHNILSLDYNNDGSRFATAGKDFRVRVYDDQTKQLLIDFEQGDWNIPGHTNRIFSLKFLPDQPDILLSCGWDSNIHIWDLRAKKSVAHFYGPKVSGDSLDYKNNQILTGSYRNTDQIQLWDFNTRKLIKKIDWEPGIQLDKAYIYSIQFSKKNDETITAACSGLNEVRVFDQKDRVCGCINDMSDSIYTLDYCNTKDVFAFAGTESIIYLMNIENK
ncbi:hypothetical protein ABPG74_010648 [Tetrahymena malaccensis]